MRTGIEKSLSTQRARKISANQCKAILCSPTPERDVLNRALEKYRASMPFGCTPWAKKYVSRGPKRVSMEQLRKLLGLESVKMPKERSSRKRPYRTGRTFAGARWIPRSGKLNELTLV